jgi:hypothetical protein
VAPELVSRRTAPSQPTGWPGWASRVTSAAASDVEAPAASGPVSSRSARARACAPSRFSRRDTRSSSNS